MNKFINNCSGAVALALLAGVCQADALLDPYATSNRNPFVQVYGLPAAQSAQLLAPSTLSSALQLEVVQNFTVSDEGSEGIIIDGETHRANLQLRYGLREGIEIGLDVPYLSHESGGLDSFIDDWHDFFNLPDGDRTKYEQDQFFYIYQRDGEEGVMLTRSADGLGDISASLGLQLSATPTRQWALRSAIKLPTGDADKLLGSESTDISLGINVSDQGLLAEHNIVLHASTGVLWMDEGEILDRQREDWVVFGSSTLSWLVQPRLSLKLQLDAHTAFYDSATTELGGDSAQLILGGAFRLGSSTVVDLSVSEDIVVDTAPDVVFQIGIKVEQW